MFKLLNEFTYKEKRGYFYKRASHLYYSPINLGKETETGNFKPVPGNLTLSEFVLTL